MKKTGFIGYLTYIGKLALFLEWSILGEKNKSFWRAQVITFTPAHDRDQISVS
jgi:hypothetical protein